MRIVMPLHEPTFVPLGTDAPTVAGEPAIAKLVASHDAPADVPVTVAATVEPVTGPVVEFVKFPLRACVGPPGYRPVIVLVWLTVMPATLPTVAPPLPVPLVVQYAWALVAATTPTTSSARIRNLRRLRFLGSIDSSFGVRG